VMQLDEMKAVKAWLKERPNSNSTLFPSKEGWPISRRTLDYHMKRYGEAAGIPADKRHFHSVTSSITAHILEAGRAAMLHEGMP